MALYGKIKAKLVGKPFCTMVVLAAGSSKRMGRDKLMMEVGGVPVLVRSLQAMQTCAAVDELIVVTRTSRLEEIAALRDRYGLTKMTKVVVGGMTRAESSLAGVLAASGKATLIGIHDAARPLGAHRHSDAAGVPGGSHQGRTHECHAQAPGHHG